MARLRLIMIWTPGNKAEWINPEQIVRFAQEDGKMFLHFSNGEIMETLTDLGAITNKAGGDYVP